MLSVAERTAFAAWLANELRVRGLSQTQLAAYIARPSQTVSAWINEGRTPKTDACLLIAQVFHLDPDDVFRAAGHLPPLAAQRPEPELPSWLRATLAELTDPELRVVERTAQGLLALREDRSQLEPGAAEPAPPAPRPHAPGEPPPATRP